MDATTQITAADGHELSIYRAEPAGRARGGLVVAQEIFGVKGHIRAVCDDFAAEGYLAVAPALFVIGSSARWSSGVPELAAEQPTCPVQLQFGEQDHAIPLDGARRLPAAHPDVPDIRTR